MKTLRQLTKIWKDFLTVEMEEACPEWLAKEHAYSTLDQHQRYMEAEGYCRGCSACEDDPEHEELRKKAFQEMAREAAEIQALQDLPDGPQYEPMTYEEEKAHDQFYGQATMSDAADEYTRNAGADAPQQAWILTPYDTWQKNPHYQGEPVPHPEDYDPWEGVTPEEEAFYASLGEPEAEEAEVEDLPF